MRALKDIKGQEVIEVTAAIAELMEELAALDFMQELFTSENKEVFASRIMRCVGKLLRRSDLVIPIISAIDGKGVEEYTESMTLDSLSADIISLLSEAAFIRFFI